MLDSLKHIYFCFLFSVISVYSQNTSVITPLQSFSEAMSAPGKMAVDTQDNIYVTEEFKKNKQLFIGDKATGNSYKVAQFI